MQSSETYLQSYSNVHTMSFNFIKASTLKDKIFTPTQRLTIKKKSGQKYSSKLTLVSSETELSALFPQELLQSKKVPLGDLQSHAKHCISLIEDPLWKQVCTEFMTMMGPLSVLKILDCRLGSLSPRYKIIYIYCKTEEESEFIQTYSFVILGSLQKYFPAVKSLKVKITQ